MNFTFDLKYLNDEFAFYKPEGYTFVLKKLLAKHGGKFFKMDKEWYICVPQKNTTAFETEMSNAINSPTYGDYNE